MDTKYDIFQDILLELKLITNSLGNPSIGLNNDLVDFERGLDRIGLIVDPFQLFQSPTLRLDTYRQHSSYYRISTQEDVPEEVP
jgi:hypothetical protein